MSELDTPIAQYASVQKYLDELDDDLTEEERRARLDTLRAFCLYVGRTPDEMAEEIFDRKARKYRKRGFYSARVKEFQQQVEGPWHLQVARGNVIRSFFIANGSRIPPEQPPWL